MGVGTLYIADGVIRQGVRAALQVLEDAIQFCRLLRPPGRREGLHLFPPLQDAVADDDLLLLGEAVFPVPGVQAAVARSGKSDEHHKHRRETE